MKFKKKQQDKNKQEQNLKNYLIKGFEKNEDLSNKMISEQKRIKELLK
jgi:hypothetical protein